MRLRCNFHRPRFAPYFSEHLFSWITRGCNSSRSSARLLMFRQSRRTFSLVRRSPVFIFHLFDLEMIENYLLMGSGATSDPTTGFPEHSK